MKTIYSVACRPGRAGCAASNRRVPLAVKLGFTAFMAVFVPVYWSHYGPTNFLYFCDLALFVTFAAIWLESALLASMAAVGILIPQFIWCADFAGHFVGLKMLGMTDYMFDPGHPLFLRALSFFHGWLPFLLLYLVIRLGYDHRALFIWTAVAWTAMLISYFLLPAPCAAAVHSLTPVNVDYVYGFSDTAAQTWLPGWLWLCLLLTALPVVIFTPTHFLLRKCQGPVARTAQMKSSGNIIEQTQRESVESFVTQSKIS